MQHNPVVGKGGAGWMMMITFKKFSQKNFPIKITMLANLQLICDG
jgi:hypothetical protein